MRENRWVEREQLREKGQFWTPHWVAKAMVSYVVEDSALVFDPAVGKGAFYLALKDLTELSDVKFYGIDELELENVQAGSRLQAALLLILERIATLDIKR